MEDRVVGMMGSVANLVAAKIWNLVIKVGRLEPPLEAGLCAKD